MEGIILQKVKVFNKEIANNRQSFFFSYGFVLAELLSALVVMSIVLVCVLPMFQRWHHVSMQWIVAEQHYKEVDYALRYLALHYTGFTVLSIIENGEFDSVVVSDAKGVTTEIGISNGQLYVHRVRHDYLTFTPKLIQSFSISKTGRRLQFIASYDNVKKQRVNVIFR